MTETRELQPTVTRAGTVRFAVVIPAYQPDAALLELIAALSEKTIPAIVVVDDGSGHRYREIFGRAAAFPKVRLLRHAVNLGKGAALKTGINYALCEFPDLAGVITADADGQHHPDDIEKVATRLAAAPGRMILGVRGFDGHVPIRSRFGNTVTRAVMHALVGQNLSDTQTGLRGIPRRLLPQLLRTETNGYDFELDMLIAVRQQGLEIEETPIRTMYAPGNRTSHFNPLIDSMKIYFVLLRFSSVSLMTAALDSLVFYLAYRRLGNIALSQVLGRVLAVAFNYSMVRRTVFFSRHRHLSTLPKYLLLVCGSGLASYAGIQLLNSRFQIYPLTAKLLVETVLFFANFAIQRDFIFGKSTAAGGPSHALRLWWGHLAPRVVAALVAATAVVLVAITIYGLRAGHLFSDPGWTATGKLRLWHYTWVFWAVGAALLLAVPRCLPAIVAAVFLVATAIAVGPLELLAVAAFLISACALGSLLLRAAPLFSILAGIAVYIFLMTFLARLPVNYPAVYLAMLALPVLMDWRGVWRRLVAWVRALAPSRTWTRARGAAFLLLVFVLGMHWLFIPQPESSADGLAMHLAIPLNIARHHVFTYQPGRIFWSVMPMGADWCYTIVHVLAGEFAARLLDFAMLLIVAALLYVAVRRWVTPAVAYLILALFASTSLVQMVTGSLLVENFLAAMILGAFLAIWRFGETGDRRLLYAAALLAGTAMAIKLGALAYLAAAFPVAAIEAGRQWKRLGPRPALAAVLVLIATAVPSYAVAWRMTGDPLFPFMNRVFPSPLLDAGADFTDLRYHQPLAWHTPFDLTFHTDRYYEGRPGGLGFAYFLFVPLGLLAALAVTRRPAVAAAAASLAGFLIVLKLVPNARYLYPALPLMLLPVAVLFGWLRRGALRRALIVLAVACVTLNAWFLSSSSNFHSDFYEQAPLSRAARQAYIRKYTPVREIGQYMNRTHPGAPVFLAAGGDLAAFNAETYSEGWHQYAAWTQLQRARTPLEVAELFGRWKVRYIVSPKPRFGLRIETLPLARLLNECSTAEYETETLYLARLQEPCAHPGEERLPLPVARGFYDDLDPAIAFRGRWVSNPEFSDPFGHTVTYSDLPGSQFQFAFEGNLFAYFYTMSANRGIADVMIDGAHQATIDLYSPITEWRSRTYFRHLGAGHHLAVITILPQKNPRSTGRFVDIDALEVR